MKHRTIFLLTMAISAWLHAAAVSAQSAANAFDGNWRVVLTCAPYSGQDDGAKPYRHEFPAVVKDSVFEGTHGELGQPSWHYLHGMIEPDGSARLLLDGVTGNPAYTVNNRERGTPYTYRVDSRFERNSGTGQRIGKRTCDFRFTRS